MEVKDSISAQTDSSSIIKPKSKRSNKKSVKINDTVPSKITLENEMQRDSEYRRLNAMLREKENEIKMLESKKKVDDLTMRLTRASLSENMTKNKAKKKNEVDSNQNRANQKVASNNDDQNLVDKKVASDNDEQNRVDKKVANNTDIHRDSNVKSDRDTSKVNKKQSGLLRVNIKSSDHVLTEVEKSRIIMETREREERKLLLAKEQNEKMLEDARRALDRETLFRERQKEAIEVSCSQHIEDIRKDKPKLQDLCLLGLTVGASSLYHLIKQVETATLETISIAIAPGKTSLDPIVQTKIKKLWTTKSSILGMFVDVLRGCARRETEAQVSEHLQATVTKVRATLLNELQQTSELFSGIARRLKAFFDSTSDIEHRAAVGAVVQEVLLVLADLARYQELYCYSSSDPSHPDWREAGRLVAEACEVGGAGSNGKVHSFLAMLAYDEGDGFETAYQLCREMCATQNSSNQGREWLLKIFENERRNSESLNTVTALSRLSFLEHRQRFVCHFLAAVGIAYTRVGADKFSFHLDKMSRHLGSLLQAIGREALASSGRGHKGHFKDFNQEAYAIAGRSREKSTSLAGYDESVVYSIDADLYKCLLICLSVFHFISIKNDLQSLFEGIKRQDCYGTMNPLSLSPDDRLALEKRYISNQLQKFQATPGLLDTSRLLVTFATTLLGANGLCSTSSIMDDAASTMRLASTTRTISTFYDWIGATPTFQCMALVDKTMWEHMEEVLSRYLESLPTYAKELSLNMASSMLSQDRAILGFSPLNSAAQEYVKFPAWSSSVYPADAGACVPLIEGGEVNCYMERFRRKVRKLNVQVLVLGQGHREGLVFEKNRSGVSISLRPTDSEINDSLCLTVIRVQLPEPKALNVDQKKSLISLEEFMRGSARQHTGAGDDDHDHVPPVAVAATDGDVSASNLTAGPAGDVSTSEWEAANLCASREGATEDASPADEPEYVPKRGILQVAVPTTVTGTAKNGGPTSKRPQQKPQKKDEVVPRPVPLKRAALPLIVVDAPNVAMRHGLNAKFSCRGVKLALDFFRSAGHAVLSFLPDYYLNFDRVGELRRLATLNIGEVRAAQLPDDIGILKQLVDAGVMIGTPSQDYDDSYCLSYARSRGGYVVSNDMYRDHIKQIKNAVAKEEARKWIKGHVISYVFVGDEFLPNPDAVMDL